MCYSEHLPHPELRRYIAAYWTLNLSGQVQKEDVVHRILPDGCADLIFDSAEQSFLVGTMTRFKETVSRADVSLFGIRFKAGGMNVFYPLAQNELLNLSIPYQDKKLAEIIWRGKDLIELINQYFLAKLPQKPSILSAIIADIQNHNGAVSLPLLNDRYAMSERKMERLFKKDVGTTIKGYCKITRFIYAMDLLEKRRIADDMSAMQHTESTHFSQRTELSQFSQLSPLSQPTKFSELTQLSQLALQAGYYDQAHLCNELKLYTGLTPLQLSAER